MARLASIAIIIGVCVAGAGFVAAIALAFGSIGGLGDCGSGCQEQLAAEAERSDWWMRIGFAGIVIVVAGVVARISLPKRQPPR